MDDFILDEYSDDDRLSDEDIKELKDELIKLEEQDERFLKICQEDGISKEDLNYYIITPALIIGDFTVHNAFEFLEWRKNRIKELREALKEIERQKANKFIYNSNISGNA